MTFAVMAFGALLALIGIVLFWKLVVQDRSSVKVLGVEFKLGGTALIIYVLVLIAFLVPVIWRGVAPKKPPSPVVDQRLVRLFDEWRELPEGSGRDAREPQIREIMARKGVLGARELSVPELERLAMKEGLIPSRPVTPRPEAPVTSLAKLFDEYRALRRRLNLESTEARIRAMMARKGAPRDDEREPLVSELERLAREGGLIGRRGPTAGRDEAALASLFAQWRELRKDQSLRSTEVKIRSVMAELGYLGEAVHQWTIADLERLARKKGLIP